MINQYRWALGILAAAIALAALMILLRPQPDQVATEQLAPLVQTLPFKPATGSIPIQVSGTVQPRDELVISAQVSGRITYVSPAFREGQFVAANSLLLRIDPTDFENQLRIAQADVAAQEVAVLQAREEVEIARADLAKFSQRESARDEEANPSDANGYAAQFLPPASLSAQPLASDRPEARDDSPGLESGLATREPQLRSAEAARDRATATLSDAKTALNRTRIAVPYAGLVRDENASLGTFVQVGQSLGSVASTSAYEVRLFLSEQEAALIPGLLQGSGRNISAAVFYDYGGLTFRWPAVVDRADAGLDETTRNIEVFLKVSNPIRGGVLADPDNATTSSSAPPLLLGAFVDAQIEGTTSDSYAEIPASALRPGNTIWVVRDGKLQILTVRVIQRSDQYAYITHPTVRDGGLLVTSSLGTPSSGMEVRTSADTAQ